MKSIPGWLLGVLLMLLAVPGSWSQTASSKGAAVPGGSVDEGKSPESLLTAIYAAISGPAGERDWAHFRTLFLPEARFTRTSEKPEGRIVVNSLGVEEFVKSASDYFMKEGFYESGMVHRIFRYGRMVDAISSYESRHATTEKPFARGINSVQMINDGKRWWVVSIAWDDERPGNPLPNEFAGK